MSGRVTQAGGRGSGGKTQAVRETIRDRIKDQLEAYANADPQNRSSKLLPRVPMEVIAKWAADDIRGRPLQAKTEVIPEPLKARIITKGEHLAYFAAMPLQNKKTRGERWLRRGNSPGLENHFRRNI